MLTLRADLKTAVYEGFPWQPPSETNPTTTYHIPLVLSDVVLFHATLQQSVMCGKKKAAEWFGVNMDHLSSECIRLLRERVETETGGDGVCDQVSLFNS